MKTLLVSYKKRIKNGSIYQAFNFIELIITYYLARIRHFILLNYLKLESKNSICFLTLNSLLKRKLAKPNTVLDGYRLAM
jgi:hypothetical protein